MCNLSGNIMDYHNVSQGKTTIPGVDDGEESTLTDVRFKIRTQTLNLNFHRLSEKSEINFFYPLGLFKTQLEPFE